MTHYSFKRFVLAAGLLAALGTRAQTNDAPGGAEYEQAPPSRLNKIGLSYRMGMNITVDFQDLGGLQLSDPGPATGSAYNRNYDNGYNRVDSSGNAGGLTWYWGYQNDLSHQGSTFTLQSESTPATATSGKYEDYPQSGVELTYGRELRRGKRWRLGAEGGFGCNAISIKDEQTVKYFVNRTSDSFALGSVIPPLAPYMGTFEGPGPLISSSLTPDNRSVAVLSEAATIIGTRKVESDLFTLRLGPYLEVPLGRKFAATLNGGLILAVADTKFSFSETVLISDPLYSINLTSARRSGSDWETDFLVGGYAGANLSYAVSDRVGVFAGAMFQSAGQSLNAAKGKKSVLDLGKSVIVSIGATYSF